jgi:hypothetical protein
MHGNPLEVNVPVKKGEYIAIKTKETGTLNCSGGSGTLLHASPLPVGGPFKKATDTESCTMLIRLVYKQTSARAVRSLGTASAT